MKKIIALMMALAIMATPVSAATTGNWDFGAANQSAANAATQLWQEQQNKPQEEELVETKENETNYLEFVFVDDIKHILKTWSFIMFKW